MNYGITIWSTTNRAQLKRIQKLLNFSSKVAVAGRSRHDHASPILDELKWLTVRKKGDYEQCIFMYNIFSNKYPNWLLTLPTVSHVDQRSTRQQDLLYIPRTNPDCCQRSVLVRGLRAWNALPPCIRNIRNVSTFKSLKDHMLH